jgi:hypothetical protein
VAFVDQGHDQRTAKPLRSARDDPDHALGGQGEWFLLVAVAGEPKLCSRSAGVHGIGGSITSREVHVT